MQDLHPSRTERRTMKVQSVESGMVIERPAPDAAEMVARGTHVYVDRSVPSIVDRLSELGVAELSRLAAPQPGDRDFLIGYLVPRVESGAVVLPE